MKKACIAGASGKRGCLFMVQHRLDRRYEVVGVCGECSAQKLDISKELITNTAGATNDREVIV